MEDVGGEVGVVGADRGVVDRGEGMTASDGFDILRGRLRDVEGEGEERGGESELCWASLVRAAIFSRSC